ncbi:hypothetical protein [Streptomyces sp. enrichment culture]|uniref:hypothetical protein n=1 Tax=Streptomyces sp. enrichment culture TaxID=1795815 RepID=UPI003F55785D
MSGTEGHESPLERVTGEKDVHPEEERERGRPDERRERGAEDTEQGGGEVRRGGAEGGGWDAES